MKTVEENEVVYLAWNNHTLVAELLLSQTSDQKKKKKPSVKKKVESKYSDET